MPFFFDLCIQLVSIHQVILTSMRYLFFSVILIIGFTVNIQAQKGKASQFKVAFYNTENLFDTIDDPHKSDNDFLPSAKVPWTSERYFHKLNNIARVLVSIDSLDMPAVIGLAEVENIDVLNDLVNKTPLHRGNYQAILVEGGDPRGIDVALIFRKDVMHEISHKAFPGSKSFTTRSILYVKLEDAKKDTFHLFVNHWKSREGGGNETETKRLENAASLKYLTDSILTRNPMANIVAMGDLNDNPTDKSISEVLGALKPDQKITPTGLYDLMALRFQNGEGTLYYKSWDLFDQIIVSGNLLTVKKQGKGVLITYPFSTIFKQDWMLYKNNSGVMVPARTASSKEYFGGFSDHLPVFVTVNY